MKKQQQNSIPDRDEKIGCPKIDYEMDLEEDPRRCEIDGGFGGEGCRF
jgi:hypothetical protein